jgi:hypothetical protein
VGLGSLDTSIPVSTGPGRPQGGIEIPSHKEDSNLSPAALAARVARSGAKDKSGAHGLGHGAAATGLSGLGVMKSILQPIDVPSPISEPMTPVIEDTPMRRKAGAAPAFVPSPGSFHGPSSAAAISAAISAAAAANAGSPSPPAGPAADGQK